MSQEEGGAPVITPREVRKTATKRSRCEDYASAVADVLEGDEELDPELFSDSNTNIITKTKVLGLLYAQVKGHPEERRCILVRVSG